MKIQKIKTWTCFICGKKEVIEDTGYGEDWQFPQSRLPNGWLIIGPIELCKEHAETVFDFIRKSKTAYF